MNPKVSVIVSNYNYAHFIGETLESLLNQSLQDFEVIVVDDGSTDNSETVIGEYINKFNGRLKYIFQKNQGQPAARNTGIKVAQARYIHFLDADDLLMPQALEKLVDYMDKNSEKAMVFANSEVFDSETKKVLGYHYSQKPGDSDNHLHRLFSQGNFMHVGTICVRKEVFDAIGCFDSLFKVGPDLDMWIRIAKDYQLGYLNEIVMRRRRHGASLVHHSLKQAKVEVLRMRKILRTIPELAEQIDKKLINQKWSRAYYFLGTALIFDGQGRRGRKWLIKAQRRDPGLKKNKIIFYHALSYFPFISFIKRMREEWHFLRKKIFKKRI